MKLEAKARLRAGWWDSMSDLAKKAYLKLHPNSSMGKGAKPSAPKKPSSPKGDAAAIKQAEEQHKKNVERHNYLRDKGGARKTDKEWAAYDKAMDAMRKSGERLRRLRGEE